MISMNNCKTPEETLREYLDCWTRQKWEKMISLIQITSRAQLPDRIDLLKIHLAPYPAFPKDFDIDKVKIYSIRAAVLRGYHGFGQLADYRILKVSRVNSQNELAFAITCILKIKVSLLEGETKMIKRRVRAMVIKEAAPYKPHESGWWGVNPGSVLREI